MADDDIPLRSRRRIPSRDRRRLKWRPIKSAPKDGSWILLRCAPDGSPYLARWEPGLSERGRPYEWRILSSYGGGVWNWIPRSSPDEWTPLPRPAGEHLTRLRKLAKSADKREGTDISHLSHEERIRLARGVS